MKVLLRAVLFGVSFSARLGGVWFLFVTLGPRVSHEAVAAARLEVVGQVLGNCWKQDDSLSAEAFEAARRVIFRCGADGLLLPHEKRDPWHFVEATFSPEAVRVR